MLAWFNDLLRPYLTNSWMADPDIDAYLAHVFAAATVVLGCDRIWDAKWESTLAVIVAAAVKEYWFDMNFELPKQTWGGSTMDFVTYLAGIPLALGILAL